MMPNCIGSCMFCHFFVLCRHTDHKSTAQTFFKSAAFVSSGRKLGIRVWNDMKVSK